MPTIEVVSGFSGVGSLETAALERRREVWLEDDKRKIDRVAAMFNKKHIKLLLRCAEPMCPDPVIVLQNDPEGRGGLVFRCGCTDRAVVLYAGKPRRRR